VRPCSRRNSLSRVVEEDLLPTEEAAMANSDDSYPTNADVIQGGRAIRSNPVLLAALMSSPDASADPNAALGTHNEPGSQGGKTEVLRRLNSTATAGRTS
jgi:hypothetical protein